MRKILLFLLLLAAITSNGQELNCKVQVKLGPKVESTDQSIFQDMETSFEQFMNERRWTNDNFEIGERIDCNLIVIIDKINSASSFEATVQIQSARPIYNTSYSSILLNLSKSYADRNWRFDYTQSQSLDFNENSIQNNLTAMLAFYAYAIIGMDYDSYSKLGGTKYFEKAKKIALGSVQLTANNDKGWGQAVSPPRNRFWLADDLNNKQLETVRIATYEYHRLGLDVFDTQPNDARAAIMKAIKDVQKAYKIKASSYIVTLFMYAKTDELINVFSKAEPTIKKEAYNILVDILPTKTEQFKKILTN